MVEDHGALTSQHDRKRLPLRFDVLLNIAGVVRRHDEGNGDDDGHGKQQDEPIEPHRESLIARKRDETAHGKTADELADGQIAYGSAPTRVEEDDEHAHQGDDERYETGHVYDVSTEKERQHDEARCEEERVLWIDVVVHQDRVRRIVLVFQGVGALHVIEIVVDGVHGALHEHADGKKHARHDTAHR